MTRVDFYILANSSTADRFACSIAGKVRQQGHKIYIHTNNRDEAGKIDDLLWTHKDISFLPHSLVDSGETEDISIGWTGQQAPEAHVLINLGNDIPDFVNEYERVVEMVPTEPDLKKQARERYKRYRDSGYELHNHQIDA